MRDGGQGGDQRMGGDAGRVQLGCRGAGRLRAEHGRAVRALVVRGGASQASAVGSCPLDVGPGGTGAVRSGGGRDKDADARRSVQRWPRRGVPAATQRGPCQALVAG